VLTIPLQQKQKTVIVPESRATMKAIKQTAKIAETMKTTTTTMAAKKSITKQQKHACLVFFIPGIHTW